MTYDSRELSTYDGADIRLYAFTLGTHVWRYCTGDRDALFEGHTYIAAPVSDGGLKQKGQATTDDFVVTMVSTLPLPLLYRGTPPSMPVKLAVRHQQYGDPDAPLMWVGYVASVKFKDEITSEVLCNSQTAFLHRKGIRLAYSRECPHALYDDECQVDKSLWGENVTITGMSAVAFTYDYIDPPRSNNRSGRFINGFVEWAPGIGGVPRGWTERRSIQFQVDSPQAAVGLLGLTDGLAVGMTVTLYPGCDRGPANCALFNNISNNGGFAFMTGTSPFDGNPVF